MRPNSSAFLPDQNSPVNRLMSAFSILAPRRDLTRSMKDSMHVALERLDPLDVRRLLGEKRIERVLAFAGGVDAALHADAIDQLVHAEASR